jgi:hypothetical protein
MATTVADFPPSPRLTAKGVHIGADRDAGNGDFSCGSRSILEIRIDQGSSLVLDQLDKRAQPAAHSFEHGQSDVLPKIIGLNF